MKLIYTHQNNMMVESVRSLLNYERIETQLKNEYASGASGDLAAIETWPEVWVVNEKDYKKAEELVESVLSKTKGSDWFCRECKEKNADTFELCWNCQLHRGF